LRACAGRRTDESQGVWTLENAFCPQCRQVVTRTRQIPSACFSEDVASRSLTNLAQSVTHFAVPSPAPTPVPSPGSSTRPPRFVEGRTEGRPESAQSTPSNSSMSPPPRWNSPLPAIEDVPIPEFRPFNRDCDLPEVVPDEEKQVGEPPPPPPPKPSTPAPPAASAKPSKFGAFFKRASGQKDKPEKLPRSDKKQERPKGSSRSVTSHDSVGAMLPKFMSFSFSATGKNLLAWKKESEVLVRIELETFGGRAIDLGDLLPQRVGERVVHIRHVVEGNEVIAAILSHNHVGTARRAARCRADAAKGRDAPGSARERPPDPRQPPSPRHATASDVPGHLPRQLLRRRRPRRAGPPPAVLGLRPAVGNDPHGSRLRGPGERQVPDVQLFARQLVPGRLDAEERSAQVARRRCRLHVHLGVPADSGQPDQALDGPDADGECFPGPAARCRADGVDRTPKG